MKNIILLLLLSSCYDGSKQEELNNLIVDRVDASIRIKRQRDLLIKLICKREGLREINWGTTETVDSLIEVINKMPLHVDPYPVMLDSPIVKISYQKLFLTEPIIIRPERGDYIHHCEIDLAPGFKGKYAIDLRLPKDWSGRIPIDYCSFFANTSDSLMLRVNSMNWPE